MWTAAAHLTHISTLATTAAESVFYLHFSKSSGEWILSYSSASSEARLIISASRSCFCLIDSWYLSSSVWPAWSAIWVSMNLFRLASVSADRRRRALISSSCWSTRLSASTSASRSARAARMHLPSSDTRQRHHPVPCCVSLQQISPWLYVFPTFSADKMPPSFIWKLSVILLSLYLTGINAC